MYFCSSESHDALRGEYFCFCDFQKIHFFLSITGIKFHLNFESHRNKISAPLIYRNVRFEEICVSTSNVRTEESIAFIRKAELFDNIYFELVIDFSASALFCTRPFEFVVHTYKLSNARACGRRATVLSCCSLSRAPPGIASRARLTY